MKTYIFFADGFEEVEAITVVDLLRRANIDVNMVSITKNLQLTGAHGINIKADTLFEENKFEDAKALILPGGMPGTKNLMSHEGLKRLLLDNANSMRVVAAICAAPSILGELGLLKGRKAISYPGFEQSLKEAIITDEKVVVDNNIITSKGLGTAIDFSLKIIEALMDENVAINISKSIQYNYY